MGGGMERWIGIDSKLNSVRVLLIVLVAALTNVDVGDALARDEPVEVRGVRTDKGVSGSFAVSGWITDLIAQNRIGTSILSSQLLRRNVGDFDSVTVRINGMSFSARVMSEALYAQVADDPSLLEALDGAQLICLLKRPGPLSHVELIVPDGAHRDTVLEARPQVPVRLELARN